MDSMSARAMSCSRGSRSSNLYRITLRFRTPCQEEAYRRFRARALSLGVFVCCTCLLILCIVELLRELINGSSGGRYGQLGAVDVEHRDRVRQTALVVHACAGFMAGILLPMAKNQWLLDAAGQVGLEGTAAVMSAISVAAALFLDPWYLSRLHGSALDWSWSDSQALLSASMFLIGSHYLLPVRWFVGVLADLASIFYAGAALFLLGSPEQDRAGANFCIFSAMVMLASFGRWASEREMRILFSSAGALVTCGESPVVALAVNGTSCSADAKVEESAVAKFSHSRDEGALDNSSSNVHNVTYVHVDSMRDTDAFETSRQDVVHQTVDAVSWCAEPDSSACCNTGGTSLCCNTAGSSDGSSSSSSGQKLVHGFSVNSVRSISSLDGLLQNCGMSKVSNGDVELEHCLETIADIGRREHWLIDIEHLRLMPHWILGKGSMGVVVAADFHGTTVAVKVALSEEPSVGADKLPNLANELRILRRLRHPNIAAFHGACVDPESGELAIVLEHVRGMRLARFVAGDDGRGGPCSFVDRHRVLLDVCSALRYLHAQSPCIVHGDLKDSNVLVGCLPMGPQARLLDFGLSRVLTRCAKPCGGTLPWMAPEVICRAAKEPAPSADVFSFARLVFFVATGRVPLTELGPREIIRRARLGQSPALRWTKGKTFGGRAPRLCANCLHPAPEERPRIEVVHKELLGWVGVSANQGGSGAMDNGCPESGTSAQEFSGAWDDAEDPRLAWQAALDYLRKSMSKGKPRPCLHQPGEEQVCKAMAACTEQVIEF